jgi:hypothetical protein
VWSKDCTGEDAPPTEPAIVSPQQPSLVRTW